MAKKGPEPDMLVLEPDRSRAEARLVAFLNLFRSPREQLDIDEPAPLCLLTKLNLQVAALLLGFALFFFTFQFHSSQEPEYHEGGLFNIGPSLFLQEHRHVVLDYFLAYGWVAIFISLALCYFCLAIASERKFHVYGLAFLVCWLAQFTLQMLFNVASPVRVPGTELEFIRHEVFPWSENLLGVEFGALPSGHFGVTLLTFLLARERGVEWLQKVSLGGLLLMSWAVLYLGEHFIIDLMVSAVLYPLLFYGVVKWVLDFD